MRNSIKFLLGDENREIRAIEPTLTVLEYLRGREGRVGTKEGCAEGDCGSCTVVVGRLEGDTVRYRAVDSCILLMVALDGGQLLTVEDLGHPDGTLHPVQRAMVREHASQCGFCTPGFVMSLFALYQDESRTGAPGTDLIEDTLAGNLCRCTGYGPIIAAARAMSEADGNGDRFGRDMENTVNRLRAMQDDETICIEGPNGGLSFSPAMIETLADLLDEHPDASLVAGGTDVGLWITKGLRDLSPVIHLSRIKGLCTIAETETAIEIGAAATYADAAPIIARYYPEFGEILRRLGSVQIRNLGTIGGNIANGSPIGDSLPPLIAAGATLTLRKGKTTRVLPLEAFFLGYGKQDLDPGEFIEKIVLPKPAPDSRLFCIKISKRFDQDISAVLGAFHIVVRQGVVEDIRIAFGGMAPTPKRAEGAEAALQGKPWNEASVTRAMAALDKDFTPITDMRASAGYRRQVARNLLMKLYLETTESQARTRILPTRKSASG